MSLKVYIFLISICTILCWVSFGIVLWNINPFEAEIGGFILFYFSLFLSLMGVIALGGSLIRMKLHRNKLIPKQAIIAFRQAIWFSGLIIFFLILQGFNLLYWWNISLFILFLAVLEFFFISLDKK
ncbi:hypothetical protein CVV26_00760 [Candidatus Kuenenbacteria bacterium HGW-Kuenenbacteria-1]|uniref:MFS transporter n=1 Tax=Candidatus Kuenenbacteria bacterium HGW-Kuenenbacteria-1 TaxID=2013812 RepID=A0A2N1UNU9_9BACT|nr:MAG: hypothetical protein CVV26_00760 [Candidatus Kuenenbacteria bacterium HGW-Kuenenbacteria-1]